MYQFAKRAMDIILSAMTLLCLSPVLVIVALSIKLTSKGPVLFKQKRFGKNKVFFDIYKFRTMRNDAPKDVPTHMLDTPTNYLTPVGRVLRKTSLDELPQLVNILLGEMTLVGPRPALWNQEDLIEERDKYNANSVIPGLTGWAQINGRDELPIDVKAKYDGEYIEKMGFIFDLKCILKTFTVVFTAKGIKDETEPSSHSPTNSPTPPVSEETP
jgi:O-antigen biosynthesis protein WbqP